MTAQFFNLLHIFGNLTLVFPSVESLERRNDSLKARLRLSGNQTVRSKVLQKIKHVRGNNASKGASVDRVMVMLRSEIGKRQKQRHVAAVNHAYRLAGR